MAITQLTGFETGQIQAEPFAGTFSGTVAISTVQARTGSRSLRSNPSSGASGHFVPTSLGGYIHVAIYIATMPTVARLILGFTNSGNAIRLNANGTLSVLASGSLVGTSASALSTGQWYWLGMTTAATTSAPILQVDGTTVVSGTSAGGVQNVIGCAGTEASAIDIYYDDLMTDDTGFLAPSKVAYFLPVADQSNTNNLWTGGGNTTATNLWSGVDNVPPAGVASASETDATNIQSADKNLLNQYNTLLQTYTNMGIVASDTLLAIQAFIQHGEDIATGTKTGKFFWIDNPNTNNTQTTFTFGGDIGAHGASPTNWAMTAGVIVTSFTGVTLNGFPQFAIVKTDSTTRVGCVDLMAAYLAYTPASGTPKTGGPDTAGTTTDASSLTATMTPTDSATGTDASATLDRTGSGDTAGSATDASSLTATITSAGDTANAATETSSVALPITSAGDTAGSAVDASAALDRTGSGDTAGAAVDATANLARTGSGDTAGATTDASALTAALTSSGDTAGAATDASALSVGVTSAGDTAGTATDASSLAAALTSAGDTAGAAADASSLAAALSSAGDTAGAGVDASVSIGLSSAGDTAGATVDASTVDQGTGTVSAADTAGATVDASSLAAALTSAGDTAGSATDATSSIGLASAGDTAGATTDASSLAVAVTSAGETAGATADASALTAALTSAGDTAGTTTDASALTAALTSAGDTAGAATDVSALVVPVTSAGDTAGAATDASALTAALTSAGDTAGTTVDASSLNTGTVNVSAGDTAGVTVDTSGLTAAITGGDTSGGAANADIRTFDIGWTSDLVGVSFRSIETGDTAAGYDISILNRGLVTPDVYYRPTVEERPIVAVTMYADMVARYGLAEGRRIYFAMEDERKGPFAPGAKYDTAARPAPAAAPRPVIEIPEARRN